MVAEPVLSMGSILRMPPFVRRLWRLVEARRALLEGAAEHALEVLSDPVLALSPQADGLRLKALDLLYRDAARKASLGREGSVARVLSVVAASDPVRADEWRRHLAGRQETGRQETEQEERAEQASDDARPSTAMKDLLANMRAGKDAPAPRPEAPSKIARSAPAPGAPMRFHLMIDDGGEFLALSGASITIGHSQAGKADVPLLGDLESLHARITFEESFHGGARWKITPESGGKVSVDGRRAHEGEAMELIDGAEVRLSPRVTFRFQRPDVASASARLSWLHGLEADGAPRVLLFAPGPSGRVTLGARTSRLLPVAGVEHEVELTLEPPSDPTELRVRCAGGVRRHSQDATEEFTLPCPPDRRLDLVVGARPSSPVPFGLAITPVPPPSGGLRIH